MIAEGATFHAALLNARPMGFHAPAQLVQDARRLVDMAPWLGALATSSRHFHRGRQPGACRRAYSSAVAQE
jgi:hypothetical protein